MDDKKAREAFRVQQHAAPHPALLQQQQRSPLPTTTISLQPDHQRVIIHSDCDCWYAQVEEQRNPALRGLPLAVTQKYLCVTANYAARAAGVTKLMGIKEAKKACPNLVLVPGEDLSPYRAASREVLAVLSRWGPVEKLGLDECWIDVTQEVDRRLRLAQAAGTVAALSSAPWCGHLVDCGMQLTAHSKHRPMDLRVVQQQQEQPQQELHPQQQQQQQQDGQGQEQTAQPDTLSRPTAVAGVAADLPSSCNNSSSSSSSPEWLAECVLRLKLGAVIAAEMRHATKQETGYRFSAGIACNRLLAKLVSGLHKPDAQTTILPTDAQAFVAPLPVRALPGVGFKAESVLKSWGVATAADARSISKAQLTKALGDKHGSSLFYACRGVDPAPVVASGPAKSLTVEDSFKSCTSWQGVAQVLQVLVPDLLERLQEDADEFPDLRRTPSTLTVKWRKAGTGWQRSSASTPWPAAAAANIHKQQQSQVNSTTAAAAAADALTAAATRLLKLHLPASGFNLTLLNIGATMNSKAQGSSAAAQGGNGGIRQFLQAAAKQQQEASSSVAAAAAAAAAGGGDTASGHSSAQQLLPAQSVLSPPAPPAVPGVDLLQQARAATEARRDYSGRLLTTTSTTTSVVSAGTQQQAAGQHPVSNNNSSSRSGITPQQPVLLSKRHERRLWEMAMQQQQQHGEQQQLPVNLHQQQPYLYHHQQQQQQHSPPVQQQQQQLHLYQHQQQQQQQLQFPAASASPMQAAFSGSRGGGGVQQPQGGEPQAKRQRHCQPGAVGAVEDAGGGMAAAGVLAAAVTHDVDAPGVSAAAVGEAAGAGGDPVGGGDVGMEGGGISCLLSTTNLHIVEGQLFACEVIEDFGEEDCDGDGGGWDDVTLLS